MSENGASDERIFLHDLSNPLATTNLFFELLRDSMKVSGASREQTEYLDRIQLTLREIHKILQARRAYLASQRDKNKLDAR